MTLPKFPISHSEAVAHFGEWRPDIILGEPYPGKREVYQSLEDVMYVFNGKVTDDNGSQFNLRVDEYTLANGTTIRRHFDGYVDKGYGITKNDRWEISKA